MLLVPFRVHDAQAYSSMGSVTSLNLFSDFHGQGYVTHSHGRVFIIFFIHIECWYCLFCKLFLFYCFSSGHLP